MEAEGGVVITKRAEIDTAAPFRSVKEAIMLFGERVLAGDVYAANKLKDEMHNEASENGDGPCKLGTVTVELLEETKQNLQKAREESMLMASCVYTLQEELEMTKRELQQMKERETEKQIMETEIEDLKFVEDHSKEFQVQKLQSTTNEGISVEFQKKRYVTFANPSSLAKLIIPQGGHDAVLERHPSLKKKKKKPLISLITGIFSRKKGSSEIASTPS